MPAGRDRLEPPRQSPAGWVTKCGAGFAEQGSHAFGRGLGRRDRFGAMERCIRWIRSKRIPAVCAAREDGRVSAVRQLWTPGSAWALAGAPRAPSEVGFDEQGPRLLLVAFPPFLREKCWTPEAPGDPGRDRKHLPTSY